jgi:hypothetical protein
MDADDYGPHGCSGRHNRSGGIPIFDHPDAGTCLNDIQACANCGARCLELTNRGEFEVHIRQALVQKLLATRAEVQNAAHPQPHATCFHK